MITNVIAAFTLVLAVHPAAAQTPTTMLSDAVQHASGWRQGRAEALRDIKNDRMCIYSAGMRDPGEWLDRESGLPVVAIAACSFDERTLGRLQGYNQTIRNHVARNGSPPYSFKRWESELFALKAYFDGAAVLAPPVSIRSDGPPFVSEDQTWTLRLVKPPDQEVSELRLTRSAATLIVLTARPQDDEMQILIGPAGSEFAVLRYQHRGAFSKYVAIDVRRGVRLRSCSAKDDK